MNKRCYYEILQVSRDADQGIIKKAYRQLALQYHPDRNPGDAQAEDRFKEAAEAYEVLRDPEKRQVYDRYGHDGLAGQGFSGFSSFEDIFSSFSNIFEEFFGFGGRRTSPHEPLRGADLRYDLSVTYEEASCGKETELTLRRNLTCRTCGGDGAAPGAQLETCATCKGVGHVVRQQGWFKLSTPCPACGGQGRVIGHPCLDCGGQGLVEAERRVSVRVPAGVDHGSRLRLRGEGEGGLRGGPPGDLYVVIHLEPHHFFQREGDDVYCQVSVSMAQAALGDKIDVPTLGDGRRVSIPRGTQSGDLVRLRGEGFPHLRGMGHGDQVLQVRVMTPTDLTGRQEDLLRQFAAEGPAEESAGDAGQTKRKAAKKRGLFG
ncbi:MAG: molecular chaperone DnaJ [Proteobacteria bacterium]|nr:molecular chaperone DnaJ [Pseudomonadota bacterium]